MQSLREQLEITQIADNLEQLLQQQQQTQPHQSFLAAPSNASLLQPQSAASQAFNRIDSRNSLLKLIMSKQQSIDSLAGAARNPLFKQLSSQQLSAQQQQQILGEPPALMTQRMRNLSLLSLDLKDANLDP